MDIDKEDEEEEEEEENYYDSYHCATIHNLIDEMKLGDESHYDLYVNYLLNEPWGELPSAWSEEGKVLFN